MKTKNNKLLNKLFRSFLLQLLAITILIPTGVIVFVIFVEDMDFQWFYNISPELYFYFRNLFYNITDFSDIIVPLGIILVIAISLLMHKFLKQVFIYINSISEVSEDLMNKDVEYITLPDELVDIQNRLNHLKRTAEQNEKLAKESEQRKNDLIVYLAHDLKTPLTSMIGYLSLLDEVKDMPKKQREKYINVALEKSYKLEDLLNELFDIARFNSEKIILEKEPLNLTLMLEQIVDDFYPLLKDNNKEIKLEIKDKITLTADPDKLARVFNNLIKNAIYYSTEKEIKISVKKEDKSALISISNKGKKIPEEKLKRIFEKFYRADSSRTTRTGGSGLGLAIAKEIVELHAGTITATSTEEVTEFLLTLPLTNLK